VSLPLAIASYVIIWWVVFFALLPIGISTQGEAGDVVEGTPSSAPARHRLPLKLLATTLISGALFAGFYHVMTQGLLALDDIPFLPRFEPLADPSQR